jgi:CheY-like chemotaxis protein
MFFLIETTKMTTMKFPKLTVLIVESNRFLVNILHQTLNTEFNITVASNGIEAMGLLEKGLAADFIITDLKMPKFDGLELIQLIRKTFGIRHFLF